MTSYYALVAAHERANRTSETPDAVERRLEREKRGAIEVAERKARQAKLNRVLTPGELVKPSISWLRSYWLEVVSDPGPVSRADRKITIRRREPEKKSETYKVRRDRVMAPAPDEAKPPSPGVTGVRDAARKSAKRKVA